MMTQSRRLGMNERKWVTPVAVGGIAAIAIGVMLQPSRRQGEFEDAQKHLTTTFRQGSPVAKSVLEEAIITSVPNANPQFRRIVTFDPSTAGIGDDFETLMPNLAATIDRGGSEKFIDTTGVILAPDPASREWNTYAKAFIVMRTDKRYHKALYTWRNYLRGGDMRAEADILKHLAKFPKAAIQQAEKDIAHNVAILKKHDYHRVIITDGKQLIWDQNRGHNDFSAALRKVYPPIGVGEEVAKK